MAMRLVMLLVVVMTGVAAAQPRAVEVTQTHEHYSGHHHGPAGFGGGATFGMGGQKDGPSGWVARIEGEVLPVYTRGAVGAVFGGLWGFEMWRSGVDNWGFSLPVGYMVGARVSPMRAAIGVGIDAILIDQVDDDTGVGFYAPFALARLGFDIAGFQLGADARIGYRWQIGADDHTRWQLGVYIGKTVATPPRKRRAAASTVAR